MPHLTAYVPEHDLAGHETELTGALSEAVVAVYGEWARAVTDIRLIGLPAGRWSVGGRPATAPSVTFGIRAAVFDRPDAAEIVARLVAGVTDAVVAVLGEPVRSGVTVELVATPPGRTAVGGVIAD
jgi:phenylpyruvate tautomerase PptA (4-oxalocrotonate tautomerase family)